MKKEILFLTIVLSSFNLVLAQSDSTVVSDTTTTEGGDTIPKNWKTEIGFGLNGSQSSFVNWNAGGRNNVSALALISATATYNKGNLKWNNNLNLSLGGLQFVGPGSGQEILQKTDDRIELGSDIGYNIFDHVFLSFMNTFKTQFLDGFNYPDDSVRVSGFMAPGYYSLGLGLDYTPNEHFSLFVSPLAGKITFVNDQRLADAGAFGVEPAVYDTAGLVITNGQTLRTEFGANLKMRANVDLAKNINMTGTLELFSNYLDRPQNIDVNADVLFTFKVNSWFQASLNWALKYDHDIDILDADGGFGPRLQFKSVLALGITYKLKNYKE